MKNIIIIVILVISIAFIFIKGENDIKKSSKDYVAIGFENVEQNIFLNKDNFSAFSFFVDNKNEKEIKATIEFFIDNKIIDKINLIIEPEKKESVLVTQKIKEFIKNNPAKEIVYSTKVAWDERKDVIDKKIIINN